MSSTTFFSTFLGEGSFEIKLFKITKAKIPNTNTTIKVQYKNLEGQWIYSESYLVSTLSKDRNKMNSYEVDFNNQKC